MQKPNLHTIQRDAAEQAVTANLAARGLVDLEPSKPAASAEPAQSATESVAAFIHTPKSAAANEEYPDQTWFCMGINSKKDAVNGFSLRHNSKHESLSNIVNLSIGGSTNNADFSITRSLTAVECENLARKLIDAAHHLRTFKSNVPA